MLLLFVFVFSSVSRQTVANIFEALMKWLRVAGPALLEVHYQRLVDLFAVMFGEKAPCQK